MFCKEHSLKEKMPSSGHETPHARGLCLSHKDQWTWTYILKATLFQKTDKFQFIIHYIFRPMTFIETQVN